jgi:mevalonate kinase
MLMSIPSKVSILGEYAIMDGLPALVAAIAPRLTFVSPSFSSYSLHPQSPAGLLLSYAKSQGIPNLGFSRKDTYLQGGGFGSSTAEFIALYSLLADSLNWALDCRGAWECYRYLTQNALVPPSGADLIAQYQGGVSFVTLGDSFQWEDWGDFLYQAPFLVFSATSQPGRKVLTHDHLKELGSFWYQEKKEHLFHFLEAPLLDGMQALREKRWVRLGQCLDQYAEVLHAHHLESSSAYEDRKVLRALPGVLGVKGVGALLADAVLVLLDPSEQAKAEVLRVAQCRGLELLLDGFEREWGMTPWMNEVGHVSI